MFGLDLDLDLTCWYAEVGIRLLTWAGLRFFDGVTGIITVAVTV